MNGLNDAFYEITDKILRIQGYFKDAALKIALAVLAIAVCSMAVNYGLTGTGLKENIIKLLKAVVFFAVIMGVYPKIVSSITTLTLAWGKGSTYSSSLEAAVRSSKDAIVESSREAQATNARGTFANKATASSNADNDPGLYFGDLMIEREGYTTVAPAAFLQIIFLTAGECITAWEDAPKLPIGPFEIPDFGLFLKGLLCGFFVILVGCFALLEYLMAYIEFMFVSSVGLILFPFSMWEGSKFLTEKLISAIIGFSIKLLFCTICIFLALYGYSGLADHYTTTPYTGAADQFVFIVFTCLLLFYLCKSAPAMAQSLMTGSPNLSAAGAIGAATAAVGAVAGAAGLGMRAATGGAGTLAQAGGAFSGASEASKESGGSKMQQLGAGITAAAGSVGNSAVGAVKDKAGDLSRSLMATPMSSMAGLGSAAPGGGAGGHAGGGAGGHNKNSASQRMLNERNDDGSRKTFGQVMGEKFAEGKSAGRNFVADQALGPSPATQTASSSEPPPPPPPESGPSAPAGDAPRAAGSEQQAALAQIDGDNPQTQTG
jgi:hypothetical protein